MRQRLIILLFFLAAFGAPKSLLYADNLPVFKDGDVICFIGNSITHGGAYHAFFHTYLATHNPDIEVEIHNCGVSGDYAGGMIRRFEEDVLVHQPSYAFLMTGMNDVPRHLYGIMNPDSANLEGRKRGYENYQKNTEELLELLIENNIHPILLTPTIYDQTAVLERENHFGVNDALSQFATHISAMADKYQCLLVDFNTMMNAVNALGQAKDSSYTIVGHDRVHPSDPGHWAMAFEILRTLFPNELEVSAIRIDVKKKSVSEAQNCEVKILESLSFQVFENSLPFPFRTKLQSTMDMLDPPDNFNRQLFAVDGLKRGDYKLMIDEMEVGTFTHKDLAQGINLSKYTTPQLNQAKAVHDLCFKYRKAEGRLRDLYLIEFRNLASYEGDGTLADKRKYLEARCEESRGKSWYNYEVKVVNAYFDNLDKRESFKEEVHDIQKQILAENTPVWHSYKLIKQ